MNTDFATNPALGRLEGMIVPISDREFGELSQRVHTLEATTKEIREDVKSGNAVSDQILHKLSAVEGGWRVIIGVASASAAVGGAIVKFAPMLLR